MEVKVEVLRVLNRFRTIITATKDPLPVLTRGLPVTTFTVTIMARICTVAQEQMRNRTPLVRIIMDCTERLVVLLDPNHSQLRRIRDTMAI